MEFQISLRPLSEEDLGTLDRVRNDPSVITPYIWYGWRAPYARRRQWEEDGLLGEFGELVVVHESEAAGIVSWRRVDTGRNSYCLNIGVMMFPQFRGRGFGTQAQVLLVRYLFAHSSAINRIDAGTEIDNRAEQRALEKAGFTREGILRGYNFRNGKWRDFLLYSILRDEVDLDSSELPGIG